MTVSLEHGVREVLAGCRADMTKWRVMLCAPSLCDCNFRDSGIYGGGGRSEREEEEGREDKEPRLLEDRQTKYHARHSDVNGDIRGRRLQEA